MIERIDTPGGHMLVALLLLLVGLGAASLGLSHGAEIVSFSLGVLTVSMKGK